MVIAQSGKLIRINVDGVSRFGRSAQGVKVMDVGRDDRVIAVAKIVDRDDDDDDSDAEATATEVTDAMNASEQDAGEAADSAAPDAAAPDAAAPDSEPSTDE